uniref:alpha/beta hydrolase n=1 Tax=Lachnoclostridium phocaeense TaxID=1871021 RepID=UPI0026DC590F|nr:alpha/beta hydrolase [Lachnoclostridium phocaeense]
MSGRSDKKGEMMMVQADTRIVDVIRQMQEQRKQDRQIFYDIYSQQEKRQDPEKKDTGLFFFRGEKKAPFAVVCAGGGFYYVGSIHESLPHALELSRQGYNGFALVYRTRTADAACQDLARAIRFIFDHAAELGVDTEGYSLWGGSAGARMAAYLGSYGPGAFGEGRLPRACAVIMQYTGHSQYSPADPSTYACVGGRDGIADWRVMKRRLQCMEELGIDTEFHLYPGLRHGFGLGVGTEAEGWIDDAVRFWDRNRAGKKALR